MATQLSADRPLVALAPIDGEPDPDGADCVACGRCCHHGPSTVHFLESDELRFIERRGERELVRLTVVDPRGPGFRFMRNDGARCGGLDTRVVGQYPCAIYDARPDDCRIVEPGSPCCIEARKLGHLGTSVEFKRADRIAPRSADPREKSG